MSLEKLHANPNFQAVVKKEIPLFNKERLKALMQEPLNVSIEPRGTIDKSGKLTIDSFNVVDGGSSGSLGTIGMRDDPDYTTYNSLDLYHSTIGKLSVNKRVRRTGQAWNGRKKRVLPSKSEAFKLIWSTARAMS